MAVPGSGEISMSKIAKEFVHDDYNNSSSPPSEISLQKLSTHAADGSFDAMNLESPNHPDGNTSHGMSEFYSYDHDYVPIPCNKAMDVVLVVDYTGSMSSEFNDSNTGLKAQVTNITNKVVERSSGDYRLAMVLVDAYDNNNGTLNYSNSSTYSGLPSANKHNQQIGSQSRFIHSTALVKFATANNTDFAAKLNLLATDNTNGNMAIGSGQSTVGWEVALNQILSNNFAGTFRSGVNKMIIFVTDTAPEGTSTGLFTGAEETTLMGSLSNTAIANNATISIIGNIPNATSQDGTTTAQTIYTGYANNTGGLTNYGDLDSADIVTFIQNICNTVETNFATVVTSAESAVTNSSFTMNGNVTAQGGSTVTARGFVRSTSSISLFVGASGVTNTTSGSGTGTFTANVTGLSGGTTHYYKAYATNSTGTSYGDIEPVTINSLTTYSSSLAGRTTDVCGFATNQLYHHDGSQSYPVVNDVVYSDSGGTTFLAVGFRKLGNGGKYRVDQNGVVGQISLC